MANTIADKLELAADNKTAIKAAIEAKSPSVMPTDVMSQWPDSIASIEGGGGEWGSITGTLSAQTDLQNVLNNKADLSSITGSGVSKIVAGNYITISPTAGTGEVTVTGSRPYVNGTWTTKNSDIFKGAAPSSGTISFSLSSYLPADGYNYEVRGAVAINASGSAPRLISLYGDGCKTVHFNKYGIGYSASGPVEFIVGRDRLAYIQATGTQLGLSVFVGAYRKQETY